MIDFICILLIFLEIIFTVFCCKKIVILEKKVDEIHLNLIEKAQLILEINDLVSKYIKKINKIVKIITNKRLHQAKRIIMMTIDIIQVIILLKSLNLSKGLKSIDFKSIKKVALIRIVQQIWKKVTSSLNNFCSI